MDRRNRFEEGASLLDRHIQDLSDRFAFVMDLQGLTVVPGTVAHLTGHIDVRQEVHLDFDGAVTLTVLTASTLNVEGEPTRLIAAHFSFGGLGKESTDLVEDTGIGGRIRSWCASDRRLVDVNHLVDFLDTGDRLMLTRYRPGAMDTMR